MEPRRQPLQNAAWLMGERLLRLAVTAAVLVLVARHLQPTGFGQLSFSISFAGLFAPLAVFGLEGLVVAELIRRPELAGALLGTACLLRFTLGIVSALLCVGLAFGIPGFAPERWMIVPLSLTLIWQCLEVIDLWFQRHLQSRRTVLARFGVVLAGAAIKVWLVWLDAPATWFAWAVMGDVLAFELVLLATYLGVRERPERWQFDLGLATTLARRAWPFAVAGVLVALQGRVDQFIVKGALPPAAAGAYFTAVRLIELPHYLIGVLGLSLFPGLAASQASGPTEFAAYAQRLFDLLIGCAWIIALLTTVLAPWLVTWLLGQDYAAVVPSLIILAWGLIPAAGSFARLQCILTGLPAWLQMVAALVGIALQIAIALLLVPKFGAPGAATAGVLALLCSGWLTSFILPGLRPSAGWQGRALLIPFATRRWRPTLELLR